MDVPPALAAAAEAATSRGPIVTSGESDEGVLEDEDDDPNHENDDDDEDDKDSDDDHSDNGAAISRLYHASQQPHEYLYDDQADKRDEAYVNQHLRSSGIIFRQQECQDEEKKKKNMQDDNKTAAAKSNNEKSNQNNININNHDDDNQKKQQSTVQESRSNQSQIKKMKKKKNSDAVLSCPCCFTTVCMDCQRHYRFPNQFRAMFVMNILVQWDNLLSYNHVTKRLEQQATTATATATTSATTSTTTNTSRRRIEYSSGKQNPRAAAADVDDDVIYHAVCCANCQTQVAALDMTEEVYHFFGCIAS